MKAVLERDYLAEAARPRGFAARTLLGAFAALALLFGALPEAALGTGNWDVVGSGLFRALGNAVFVFLLVTVPMLLVGSLLLERQGNTLEILLATPEGPQGLAAGKFLSRSGTALTWAAAALPVMTVAVLFGGTSWRQLLNLAAGLAGTTLELAALGLLVSAGSRKFATAVVLAYLLPAGHWVPFLPFGSGSGSWTGSDPLFLAGAATSPAPYLGLAAWDEALTPLRGTELGSWLAWPGFWHLGAGIALSALAVPLGARMLAREPGGAGRALRLPRPKFEGRLRGLLTRGNPVAWKESMLLNTAGSRLLHYLVAALLLAGEVLFVVLHRAGKWNASADSAYLTVVFTALATFAGVQGAASMVFEKTQGTFDLLRITRLTPREIARGKTLGTALGLGFLLLIPAGHLAISVAAGYHHPLTALLFPPAALLVLANYALHGLSWGTVARTPWGALAGAASLPAFGTASCSVLCFLPFLLAGLRLAKKEGSTEYFEGIVIPAVFCGPPVWVLGSLLDVLDGSFGAGWPTAGTPSRWSYGSLLFLVISLVYALYRAHRLPGLLEREMAKMAEGERGPGLWRRIPAVRSSARPTAPAPPAAGTSP